MFIFTLTPWLIHCTVPDSVVHLPEVHDGAAIQEHKEDKKQDGKDAKDGDGDKMEGEQVSLWPA